jgi:antagonist of KipI
MGIKIISPGLLTTIQDAGRVGYQKTGVSPSGALDLKALRTANILVTNPMDEACLEMTMLGASMEFTENNFIAVAGGDFSPTLNGEPIRPYTAVRVSAGSTLAFGPAKTGSRAYVAFSGGLDVPPVMGSKSTNLKCRIGGFEGRKLAMGDEIPFTKPVSELRFPLLRELEAPDYEGETVTLRVVAGPQDEYFTDRGFHTFFSETYTVTNKSDRMGCTLEGPEIEYKTKVDIISDGIPLGAVQVPSGGKPIIMLADRQTTGGYAKIGTVISTDLPLFVQRKVGGKVRFQLISVEEAQKIYRKERKILEKLDRYLNH